MHSQGLVEATAGIVTYGPYVGCRQGGYGGECVVAEADVGAGHDAPLCAVPMLCERLRSVGCCAEVITGSPHVIRGERGKFAQGVVAGSDVGTVHRVPTRYTGSRAGWCGCAGVRGYA